MPTYLAEQYVPDLTDREVEVLVAGVRSEFGGAGGGAELVMIVVVPSDEMVLYVVRSESSASDLRARWPGRLDRLASCSIKKAT